MNSVWAHGGQLAGDEVIVLVAVAFVLLVLLGLGVRRLAPPDDSSVDESQQDEKER